MGLKSARACQREAEKNQYKPCEFLKSAVDECFLSAIWTGS